MGISYREKGEKAFHTGKKNQEKMTSPPQKKIWLLVVTPLALGECLVDIRFAKTCKLTLFTFSKIFISLKNGSLLHTKIGSLSM